MPSREIKSIVILGAGNVAWHLGHQFRGAGHKVVQVVNRSQSSGRELADALHAEFTDSFDKINRDADLYIAAISDDFILPVIEQAGLQEQFVVHTAGSLSIDILRGNHNHCGVLYPLQTLTKGRPVDFNKIPVLIEAGTAEDLDKLRQLALSISGNVHQVSSYDRLLLHLAAVFASNFTNHLLVVAYELLKERGMDFSLLHELSEETIAKAFSILPVNAQTGPAFRGNISVINRHLNLLEQHPAIRELYSKLSDSIKAKKAEQ